MQNATIHVNGKEVAPIVSLSIFLHPMVPDARVSAVLPGDAPDKRDYTV